MFDSIFNVVKDVSRVVTAPVEIGADLASALTKPVADAAQDCVDGIKETVKDISDDPHQE